MITVIDEGENRERRGSPGGGLAGAQSNDTQLYFSN